jgi:hypothetical protein
MAQAFDSLNCVTLHASANLPVTSYTAGNLNAVDSSD